MKQTHGMPETTAPPQREEAHEGAVLIVDDDEDVLELVSELLELQGFKTYTASEGAQGITIFEAHSPELIISDIQMPCMDGLELIRRVRAIDSTIPVILVTGHGDLDNAIKAIQQGAYDFLQKPINPDILVRAVHRGIEHRRLVQFEKEYTQVLKEQVEERTRELARTADFLKGILNSSTGVAIVLTDFDQRVQFWNTGAERIFGYTAEEMLGNLVTILYPEGGRNQQAVEDIRARVAESTGTVHAKLDHVAKDGRLRTISMALSPMYDPSGQFGGVLSLGQDVTEETRLYQQLEDSYERIRRLQGSSIFALAKLAESRDGETGFHLRRIQDYCRVLCENLRNQPKYQAAMTQEFVDDLVQSSVLHDIGKVAIPDSVLFNPRKFAVGEYEIMKQHAVHGGRALEEAAEETGEKTYLSMGRDIAYYHHEHWDGNGYPYGLQGEEIPLAARIVAIADVYDALTTERRYKRAFSHEEAVSVILDSSGKQFDPALVDVFIAIEGRFRDIRRRYSAKRAQAL